MFTSTDKLIQELLIKCLCFIVLWTKLPEIKLVLMIHAFKRTSAQCVIMTDNFNTVSGVCRRLRETLLLLLQ